MSTACETTLKDLTTGARPASAVDLWRDGQVIEVRPPCEDLRRALRAVRYATHPDPAHGYRVRAEARPLFSEFPYDAPCLSLWAGLEAPARLILRQAGWRVRLPKNTPACLSAGQMHANPINRPLDGGLLRLVRHHDRGLVRYEATAVDPAWLIGQVALAFPALTVAVAVARVAEARELAKRLAPLVPGVEAVTGRRLPARVGRVVVATYTGLGHTPIALEHRQIVIALNAAEAVGENPRSCLEHAWRARLYGLLPRDVRLSPHDRAWVRALFGFQEVDVPRHGLEERAVVRARVQIGGGDPLPRNADLLTVKRFGLWHHQPRNRTIARLARLLADGDADGLASRFPDVARALNGGGAGRVMVLVECMEHGIALAARLPGWDLVDAEADTPELAARQRAIVTFRGLSLGAATNAEVLIRADGGTGLPPNLERALLQRAPAELAETEELPTASAGRDLPQCGTSGAVGSAEGGVPHCGTIRRDPLVLVDFDDRHHPVLRRRARHRCAAYAERGWYQAGIDPVRARVEAFVAARPKEDGA